MKMKHIKKRMSLRLVASCLLLFTLFGSALAQGNDGQYVIKKGDHYLAHVKVGNTWTLKDVTTFHPDSCLWYSGQEYNVQGTNHNYYFVVENEETNTVEIRFLKGQFVENGNISLNGVGVPQTYILNNPDSDFYFYDWDYGLARGHQASNGWWTVYWVELKQNDGVYEWGMSADSYNPTDNAGKFHLVTITNHDAVVSELVGSGIEDFTVPAAMEWGGGSANLSATLGDFSCQYTPAYTTYAFDNLMYHFLNGQMWTPTATTVTNDTPVSYHWELTGDGASYLRLSDESILAPTLTYITENTQGDVYATVTLTVTYSSGVTLSATGNVLVKTRCQNPEQASSPVVTYGSVSISWYPTASQYHLYWQKSGESWQGPVVLNSTSYTFTDLDYNSNYIYKVVAICDGEEQSDAFEYPFTTKEEPKALILGSVFGGGRMANVGGNTDVVIINTDSIGAVYGGNDIAGEVLGTVGATITLGVTDSDPDAVDYNNSQASTKVRIGDVYGGGNGYYVYDGVQPSPAVGTTEFTNGQFTTSVTDVGGGDSYASSGTIPALTKSVIKVSNDAVKVDSIFGGAKNAFVTNTSGNSTSITVDGGTVFAVFGGNNYGGTLGAGSTQYIKVNKTTIYLEPRIENTETTGYGRDFGICYLFGGGNKVEGQRSEIIINGGQCDTVFAGGNSASVTAANLTVDCAIAANSGTDYTYGNVYSNAINTYAGGVITPLDDYEWNGYDGIYNVRTLFGGNNRAPMSIVPNITLTSGSVGTAYGGGNSGDMMGNVQGQIQIDGENEDIEYSFKYGTHVVMNSNSMIVDYIYGGCQMSNVAYSTFTEINMGNVGTVYGGCNISGDVGSARVDMASTSPSIAYQTVKGATYVSVSGGIVYKNLFAGSNGYYHCNNGKYYIAGINYGYPERDYVGMRIPTNNETHVIVNNGATIKGDVYAGGNLANVGFINESVDYDENYAGDNKEIQPKFVGLASVRMTGGLVEGNVYGGGNMASVYGSNEVRVSGGTIQKALYGGNDKFGIVAQITNRVLPAEYNVASDQETNLTDLGVKTYVGVNGNAHITTVYGGGNGDYDYTVGEWCDVNDQPVQSNTFVDINLLGNTNEATGGHVGTVYGGGNGVTVTGGITVFLNVGDHNNTYTQVDTIFGGNNKGDLELAADIIMLHGQVGTVYGGCNRGAMAATEPQYLQTIGDFDSIGSYVRLLASYDGNGDGQNIVTPDINVTHAIYGGCRMNGVTNNSLVLVEGGNFLNTLIFGGSDISGNVGGWSRVATSSGSVGIVGKMYGGGNGGYYYVEDAATGEFSVYRDEAHTELLATGIGGAPTCEYSGANILGGFVGTENNPKGQIFGGGYGQLTSTNKDVVVNVGLIDAASALVTPTIYGEIYGGSALGNVNFNSTHSTTVNFLNGTLVGNLYGGGLGYKDTEHPENNVEAMVKGKVFVNISTENQDPDYCFIDLRQANIYGCNNTNGSPQDDVTVHVWKTAFNFGDYQEGDLYKATYTGDDALYAINQVFGGGNQADYAPENGNVNSQKKILVYVHECLNTIRRVFSGGNAAAAVGVMDTIQGGRMDYVFGGGNGEVTAANIGSGGTHLVVSGGTINSLFGGSNSSGDIAGRLYTEVNHDSGCDQEIDEFYGGCNLAPLSNEHGVYSVIKCGTGTIHEAYGGSKLADIVGNVTLDVRGGTIDEVYGGSKGREGTTPDYAADIDGKVTLNLEGGTITDAFGGSNINGAITDSITVNVIDFGGECGLDLTNVYGGGNVTPYTPTNTTVGPVVNVMHIGQDAGIRGKVFGGAKGATATVTANPVVNFGYNQATMEVYLNSIADKPTTLDPDNFIAYVSGIDQEDVVHADWGNVFGGGDLAAVTGNATINFYSGEVTHKVVGGGNVADIDGNTFVYVMGGNIGTDGDATTGAGKGVYGGCNVDGTVTGNALVQLTGGTVGVNTTNTANVHGGGYGNETEVVGNVTVNFGAIVIGDDGKEIYNPNLILYGELYGGSALGKVNTADTTTPGANTSTKVNLLNGAIIGYAYGGGLGNADHDASVYGRVYVKVGDEDANDPNVYRGQANLVNCNVYGCNNQNGSPQSDVFVDVYQARHIETDSANYLGGDRSYAIDQLFGGGNESDYNIEGKSVNVYIHGCDNTIRRTFGGGNAAEVYGVHMNVDGGRFLVIFGGGNGERGPEFAANIGFGGIDIAVGGGNIGTLVNGSNMHGTNSGSINSSTYEACGLLEVTDYFLGSYEADIFGDINAVISCTDASSWRYQNLYCGSNLAQIYGNINVIIGGGTFNNVFGGSKGRLANDTEPAFASNIYNVTQAIINAHPNHPELKLGHGGNVSLTINGGTIGNLYGGCDQNGNIDGKISIVVEEGEENCPLFIGNIYGGGNMTDYVPTVDTFLTSNPYAMRTPNISILKAHVGGHNAVIGDYEGNVFGGGNHGNVGANPKVIVGKGIVNSPLVDILGDVYGGGNEGNVDGNTDVVIMPETHQLTYNAGSHVPGAVIVLDGLGDTLSASGNVIGEGIDLRIKAIPSVYGQRFAGWTATNGFIAYPNDVSTLFTMGTDAANIAATFETVATRPFSYITPDPTMGSISVKDGFGETVESGVNISMGAELNIMATPADGYRFINWSVGGDGNGYVANPNMTSTTFTMGEGTGGAILSANFGLIPSHTLSFTAHSEQGDIAVTTNGGATVNSGDPIREGSVLNIVATPATGYRFVRWSLEGSGTIMNRNEATTTLTIGIGDAILTAEFVAE